MNKTSRDYDLEDLEQYRDDAVDTESKNKRTALLELVYQQAKDATLEKLRVQLSDAIKRGDLAEMQRIRGDVLRYASNKSFIKEMYNKMRQASPERAEIYVAKK